MLSNEQQASFWEQGCIGPFCAIERKQMDCLAKAFAEQFENGKELGAMNRHFDLPAVAAFCRRANFWEPMRHLLNAEGLVLWRSSIFAGNPKLDWHEDSHANLMEGEGMGLSALLAIAGGSLGNCTLVAPGSHRLSVQEKERKFGIAAKPMPGGNIRYRGKLTEEQFIRMPLQPGECIVFHPALLHASSGFQEAPSQTASGRTSIAFRVTGTQMKILPAAYAPSAVRGAKPLLMRGVDRFGLNEYGRLKQADGSL